MRYPPMMAPKTTTIPMAANMLTVNIGAMEPEV
jgi:hypothetical protein